MEYCILDVFFSFQYCLLENHFWTYMVWPTCSGIGINVWINPMWFIWVTGATIYFFWYVLNTDQCLMLINQQASLNVRNMKFYYSIFFCQVSLNEKQETFFFCQVALVEYEKHEMSLYFFFFLRVYAIWKVSGMVTYGQISTLCACACGIW